MTRKPAEQRTASNRLELKLTGDLLADCQEILSLMTFPNDDEFRRSYKLRIKWPTVGTPSFDQIGGLLVGPDAERILEHALVGIRRGLAAGDLLGIIYTQWVFGKPEPSFGSAQKQYRKWARGKRFGDEDPLRHSDCTLLSYWKEMESVAHLWAAWRLLTGKPHGDKNFHPLSDHQSIERLIGVAAAVAEFAESFAPKRTKPPKPIISPGTLVSLPKEIRAIRLVTNTG